MPTQSFNACIYTLFAFVYSVRLIGCLFREGGGAGGPISPFFICEGPWAHFYEILEATLKPGSGF